MTSEASWHELYNRMGEAVGEENADTLMSKLSESATKTDLGALRGEIRSDMAEFKTEIRSDMAQFKTEIRSDMAEIKEELRNMAVRLDSLAAAVAAQGRANAWTVASSMVGLTAIYTFILALFR